MDNPSHSRFYVTSRISPTSGGPLWNQHVDDWLCERLQRGTEQVTAAGPSGCSDRPWWWGKTETNS